MTDFKVFTFMRSKASEGSFSPSFEGETWMSLALLGPLILVVLIMQPCVQIHDLMTASIGALECCLCCMQCFGFCFGYSFVVDRDMICLYGETLMCLKLPHCSSCEMWLKTRFSLA